MRERTPIADLKAKAKEQLLGNYGIAIGSFALIFVLCYAIYGFVSGAVIGLALGDDFSLADSSSLRAIFSNKRNAMLLNVLMYILMAILIPLFSILSTGYLYLAKKISYGKMPLLSDIFFAIRNHPDKVIIISLISYAISVALQLPAMAYSYFATIIDGKSLLIYTVINLAGTIAMLIIELMISQSFLIYLDDVELGAIECIKRSINLMKGNKWRLFYLNLSFIGYGLLTVLSLGIAGLWVAPYMSVATVGFYRDICDRRTIDITISEDGLED